MRKKKSGQSLIIGGSNEKNCGLIDLEVKCWEQIGGKG